MRDIIQVIYCEDLLVKLTKKRKGCISTVDEDVNLYSLFVLLRQLAREKLEGYK